MTEQIRDLPTDDRPRERMFKHGPQTLSDSELVAIILGSGMRGKNALQLSRELVGGGMSTLRKREFRDLAKLGGMGPAKAARIGAVLELSRRLLSGEPDDPPLYDADEHARKLVSIFSHHTQERLGAVFLDACHRQISVKDNIFIGSLSRALVSTRDVIRLALIDNAAAVVLYHNHPSGNPSPSKEDIAFTAKIKQSLALCDIDLVEHLIIGAHRYCSMKTSGSL